MKYAIVAGLAALILAGPAAAQPLSDHPSGVSIPSASDTGPYYYRLPYSNERDQAVYRRQVKAYTMACRVERQARCEGRRTDEAVWSCLRIRRSKLSEPCRAATYAVERAAADANYRVADAF